MNNKITLNELITELSKFNEEFGDFEIESINEISVRSKGIETPICIKLDKNSLYIARYHNDIGKSVVERQMLLQQVKSCLLVAGITQDDFAKKIGTSVQNFNSKLQTGKLPLEELKVWANNLNAEYIAKVVCPDGEEITGESYEDMFKNVCKHINITLTSVAQILGESKQNFFSRLKKGKLSVEEVYNISEVIGCKYVQYFEFNIIKRI